VSNDDDLWNALENFRVMSLSPSLPQPLEKLHNYLQRPSSYVDRSELVSSAIACVTEILVQIDNTIELAAKTLSQTGIDTRHTPDRLTIQDATQSTVMLSNYLRLQPFAQTLLEILQSS
jgi:hypothetical protein